MKKFKIEIEVFDAGGIYSAESMEEAEQIAQDECDLLYAQMRGRCGVRVVSVEEV